MKSFLTSHLAFRFSGADADAFRKAHPHEWLLWEPGNWKPPAKTTVALSQLEVPKPVKEGEALALVLSTQDTKKPGQVTLGRTEDCDIVINDGTLSALHLVFMPTQNGWTVRDANSRNGSQVDGAKLEPGKPVALKSGARILAAQVSFTYYDTAGLLARLAAP